MARDTPTTIGVIKALIEAQIPSVQAEDADEADNTASAASVGASSVVMASLSVPTEIATPSMVSAPVTVVSRGPLEITDPAPAAAPTAVSSPASPAASEPPLQPIIQDPLPSPWTEHKDSDADTCYYYNPVTGVTQWERPTITVPKIPPPLPPAPSVPASLVPRVTRKTSLMGSVAQSHAGGSLPVEADFETSSNENSISQIHRKTASNTYSSSDAALVYSHSPPSTPANSSDLAHKKSRSSMFISLAPVQEDGSEPVETSAASVAILPPDSSDDDDENTLPFPWVSHRDPESSQIYYYNTETYETSWLRPSGRATPIAATTALAETKIASSSRRTSVMVHSEVLTNLHAAVSANSDQSKQASSLSVHSVQGSWNSMARTASGSFPDGQWWCNPQYVMTMTASRASVKITLTQIGALHPIGLMVVKVASCNPVASDNTGVGMRLLTLHDDDEMVLLGPFQPAQSVEAEAILTLPIGKSSMRVYIIPATHVPDLESQFSLNVMCDQETTLDTVVDCPTEDDGWHISSVASAWEVGSSGGCFPNFSGWRTNPQIQIRIDSVRLTEAQKWLEMVNLPTSVKWLAPGVLGIRVMAQLIRSFGDESVAHGFYVFSNEKTGILSSPEKLIIHDQDIIVRSDFVQAHGVTAEFWLPVSTADGNARPCVLVPSTFQPNLTGEFALKLFSPIPMKMSQLTAASRWPVASYPGKQHVHCL